MHQFKVAQQTMERAMIGETPKALKYKIRNEIIRHQFIERKRFDHLARELIQENKPSAFVIAVYI